MSAEKIIGDWKKKKFKPVYWLEGEEDYFIDQVIQYAEHEILTEAESGFNLMVFYGKDASWIDIVNACKRYPMFSERQVVILKEAQQMRDIDKLESYIEHPLSSTIFVVSYKEKKVDGRSKLAKTLKEKGEMLTTKKMYDNQLPDWTNELIQSKGRSISQKALMLLVDHIGNDLSRINNEIDKVLVNLGERTNITEDDIEKYVGVSKEYNPFELQSAMAAKDLAKAMKIIQYFEANPKAAPIQLILPTLYNLFSKTYMIFGQQAKDDRTVATNIGVNPFFVKDYMATARNYGYPGVESALLLLHQYNLKSVGVNDSGTSDGSLLKEMVAKMMV
ncbi:DNA polymerase III subunit delta [Pseudobacter ginsenosidimutans]|uniref:DNA polymerase III subunit delta n=1 Tax=Pseudobacter ginsenosidimutans TaxID=661488 RepID=A0A4V2F1W0_9BACT|nr:DNA polymerase III subunit delta [Pseudobacter ginsenosidimutans]QEC43734.1 DNA polymerase III subunit delta [Pseudobacter ginsenosidimutans]RZS75146.1 DNA polymerase III delta subunit [Pseudobacter ginsenosidimutans]